MTQFTDAPDVATIISRYESRISALERTRALALTPVTNLPLAPFEGQEIIFTADEANGVVWRFRYRGLNADGSPNANVSKWEAVGSQTPLQSFIATQESRAAATYNNLATIGPNVVNPLRGDYFVQFGAGIQAPANTGGNAIAYMSVKVGATAAVDQDAAYQVNFNTGVGEAQECSCVSPLLLKTGINGNNLWNAQYRITGGTANYQLRWIALWPVRVG